MGSNMLGIMVNNAVNITACIVIGLLIMVVRERDISALGLYTFIYFNLECGSQQL